MKMGTILPLSFVSSSNSSPLIEKEANKIEKIKWFGLGCNRFLHPWVINSPFFSERERDEGEWDAVYRVLVGYIFKLASGNKNKYGFELRWAILTKKINGFPKFSNLFEIPTGQLCYLLHCCCFFFLVIFFFYFNEKVIIFSNSRNKS